MCVLYKVLYRCWANDLKENIKIHVLTLLDKGNKILFFANIGWRQKSEAPPQIDESILNILTFWTNNLKMNILTIWTNDFKICSQLSQKQYWTFLPDTIEVGENIWLIWDENVKTKVSKFWEKWIVPTESFLIEG